ncbi:MAG: hypothetical protein KJ674_04435 [Nanoarchaeota archaeon]|nr:hypothetical protein [Nanoarchaeota archaeon]
MNLEKKVDINKIAQIESALLMGAIKYCEDSGYQHIIIPHLTKATGACENFSTLFATDLFGDTAYLNQTGQLMLEAFIKDFEKTYCFGPSFRKETEADNRHLIEFPLFEIELANCNLDKLQTEVSNIIHSMINNVLENSLATEIPEEHIENLTPPYDSMMYKEAIKKLDLDFGTDLKSSHEQRLVELNENRPLFITHYPQQIKFFNMRLNRGDNTVVNSMDLLMPYGGEAVGAAEREENYDILKNRLLNSTMLTLLKDAIGKEREFNEYGGIELEREAVSRFKWYLDVVKEHPIEHAGCGIGLTRVTQSLLQSTDIRDSTAYPLNRETLF